MMCMYKHTILLVLMLSLSSAAIWESGDAGKAFAKNTATAMCNEPDVAAVYICNGNVVRVVSSLLGAGSTFYKPDGRVVKCPVVAPTAMGAECLQMMTPNYCPQEEKCGDSNVTDIFPGQNDTQPEEPVVTPSEPPETKPPEDTGPKPPENNVIQPADDLPEEVPPGTTVIKTGTENPIGFLLPVVLLLGVAAVIILFLLFKNSIQHDV
ncbi:Uncharacterised protein [Candidatus Bilamarchaeum dharawalense]|uniref:Uncharacterized protein n=1 Tax=Candidatus Bilamarchaeum dharawalense TaxID=2885759 RepID=A0A5E4LP88_9ARCH|nr:Uncharacterised protein [Candidatus Bilamarchaeum dharawalense]